MSKIQIHQFSPSAHVGDGITNGMFYLQKILHELGFVSTIYAENYDEKLTGKVLHYSEFSTKDKNQILFVHYSIYYDFDVWINAVNAKKMMIYHNITPHSFFEEGSFLYDMCKKGKEYLPHLQDKVEGSIGDSNINSQELLEHNFKNVKTIPLLIDVDKIVNAKWNKNLYDEKVEEFNIIFVGRIARNKAQHDLIEIANVYKELCDDFKMYIIGSTTDELYEHELKDLIAGYNLQNNVIMTGKISDEDLYAYYRSANLFLCMSEHEGFGIPLIESMLFDLPVIAFNSSNIKSTLNGGGILVNEKSPNHIAAVIKLLRDNRVFKREVLNTQRKARQSYYYEVVVEELLSYFKDFGIECEANIKTKHKALRYQFEGPFDSSYSLAILNRYSAMAFEAVYPEQVALFSTEGGGDYEADEKFLNKNPKVQQMYKYSQKAANCDVVLRNLYPPRVTGMKGKINILNSYGWEESGFFREYVEQFNQHLDGITVMSEYVKTVLLNNGVQVPLFTVGLGAEHILEAKPKPLQLSTNKKFKFLHISSCFARKGADVLLKAYSQSFTKDDDVSLIIKTFPNPHNDIQEQINAIKNANPNAPEIVLINQDLEDGCIAWLYQKCDAFVAPTRGEGFGLPMAEAMLFHLPVITTGFGGQVDFCKDDNSWLIDYSFQKAQTHLNVFNSYWIEPDCEDLKRLLKNQITLTQDEKEVKTKKAYERISKEFTWDKYRERTDKFVEELKNEAVFITEKINIAWVSSLNTKCGIATYSEFILAELNQDKFSVIKYANYSVEVIDGTKESDIIRCWGNRFDEDNSELMSAIVKNGTNHVFINFNFGFFSMKNLQTMIEDFVHKNIKTTIVFHSVADVTIIGLEASLSSIRDTLKKVDNLLVHNIDDLNFFKNIGLSNMSLLPHGTQNRIHNQTQKDDTSFTIASYGFLLPHKGILELIEAFALLEKRFPNLKLLLVNAIYPVADSLNYFQTCQNKINSLHLAHKIQMVTDFLSDDNSFEYLDSADMLVLPYRKTNESSSAAARYAISTLKPVVCTNQPIFNDVEDIVHFTEGYSSREMANTIEKLILDKDLLHSKTQRQKSWVQEHDWKYVAIKIDNYLSKV